MGHHDRQIREAIQQLAGTHLKDRVKFVDCNVNSVDEDKGTCIATPIGGDATSQFVDIQLQSEVCDGLLMIPVIGSTITIIYSTRNAPYVYKFSDLEKIYYMGNEWQHGDGSFGGLIKGGDLKTQYDAAFNAVVAALVAAFTAQAGFDGSAGLNAFNAAITSLQPLNRSTLENTTFTHGQ